MRHFFIRTVLAIIIVTTLVECAKRGTITGGDKDEDPPVLLKATPPQNTTNFRAKTIRLNFDEYVKLNDIQKQLIVSPPMNQDPDITPMTSASKYIDITINDTLDANTTYVINFGQSIQDNNEGNPYPFFKYIFSTGDYIDSLSIKGDIWDAYNKEADDYVSVMLYKYDENYNDSLIYLQKPTYITNTLDTTTQFEITNIKPGSYKLFALKDKSNNNIFNPKSDKIAFKPQVITVPSDTTYRLVLFNEVWDYRATKPSLAAKNRIDFGFEGDTTNVNIQLLSATPDDFKARILADKEKDTLHYWFTPFETDSLLFTVTKQETIDTFTVRVKELYKDSLTVTSNLKGSLDPGKILKLSANTPIETVNNEYITVMDKDSTLINFTTKLAKNTNDITFNFETKEDNRYQVKLLPNAITDMFGQTNDTISYNLKTKKFTDYGTITVKLVNPETFPIIVQLTDAKGTVKEERFAETKQTTFLFANIEPSKYFLRVIYDANGNKKWDTGNYLKGVQPEKIFYYPDEIELRVNWEFEQQFILN